MSAIRASRRVRVAAIWGMMPWLAVTSLASWQPILNFPVSDTSDAAYSPDGLVVATASLDGDARFWNASCPEEIGDSIIGGGDRITDVDFSSSGAYLVTADAMDNTARLWRFDTRQLVCTFPHGGAAWTVAISPDESFVAVGGYGTDPCVLWDTQTYSTVRTVDAHTASVNSVEFSSDGTWILTASSDGTAKLSYTANGQPFKTFVGHLAEVNYASLSPDMSLVATASNDRTVKIWDPTPEPPVCLRSIEFPSHVGYTEFSPDGSLLVVGGVGFASVLDAANGQEVRRIDGFGLNGRITANFHPAEPRILIAGGGASVWSIECWMPGDTDCDGFVDLADLARLLANFGRTY